MPSAPEDSSGLSQVQQRELAEWYLQERQAAPGLSLREMAILAIVRANPEISHTGIATVSDRQGGAYGQRLLDAANADLQAAVATQEAGLGAYTIEFADLEALVKSEPNRFLVGQNRVLWLSTGRYFERVHWYVAAADLGTQAVSISTVGARAAVLRLGDDPEAAKQARQATLLACSLTVGRGGEDEISRQDIWRGAMADRDVIAATLPAPIWAEPELPALPQPAPPSATAPAVVPAPVPAVLVAAPEPVVAAPAPAPVVIAPEPALAVVAPEPATATNLPLAALAVLPEPADFEDTSPDTLIFGAFNSAPPPRSHTRRLLVPGLIAATVTGVLAFGAVAGSVNIKDGSLPAAGAAPAATATTPPAPAPNTMGGLQAAGTAQCRPGILVPGANGSVRATAADIEHADQLFIPGPMGGTHVTFYPGLDIQPISGTDFDTSVTPAGTKVGYVGTQTDQFGLATWQAPDGTERTSPVVRVKAVPAPGETMGNGQWAEVGFKGQVGIWPANAHTWNSQVVVAVSAAGNIDTPTNLGIQGQAQIHDLAHGGTEIVFGGTETNSTEHSVPSQAVTGVGAMLAANKPIFVNKGVAVAIWRPNVNGYAAGAHPAAPTSSQGQVAGCSIGG